MKKNYNTLKGEAIEKITAILSEGNDSNWSYGEWWNVYEYIQKLAKRFGLLNELKENGIL